MVPSKEKIVSIPLLISIPKSGTHILTQTRGGHEYKNIPNGSMIYESYPDEKATLDLQALNVFGRTHIPYHPIYEQIIRDRDIRAVFLYRDPRDLMVSYYFWVKKLGHKGQSIPGLIDNVSDFIDAENPYLEMVKFWGVFIRRYIPWMYVPGILYVSYEELMKYRMQTLRRIFRHWDNPMFGSPETMNDRIKPVDKSFTGRKGIIGDWKNHFTKEVEDEFYSELWDVLDLWGYI